MISPTVSGTLSLTEEMIIQEHISRIVGVNYKNK